MPIGPYDCIRRALRHARLGILTIALTYVLTVLVGLSMAHGGNRYALGYRDKLVGRAQRESMILRQLQRGNAVRAAGLDATANAAAGFFGVIAGYGVPAAYALAGFRGWIGGIVSVDAAHRSRLSETYEAFYYLTTLLLQLIPYSLTGGAGVNIGLAAFASASRTSYAGPRMPWLRIPYEAMADAGWLYLISLPLFVVASLFEFMA